MFRQLNTPVLGLIENMSHYICRHCGKRDDVFGTGGVRRASVTTRRPLPRRDPLGRKYLRGDGSQEAGRDLGSVLSLFQGIPAGRRKSRGSNQHFQYAGRAGRQRQGFTIKRTPALIPIHLQSEIRAGMGLETKCRN